MVISRSYVIKKLINQKHETLIWKSSQKRIHHIFEDTLVAQGFILRGKLKFNTPIRKMFLNLCTKIIS